MALTIILIIAFFAMTIGIGFYCRSKATNSDGFILGGRSVGPWLTAFAYGTSYFSAVIFVGYAGQFGWKFGVSALWIGLGNAFIGSLLAWVVLGRRTRLMSQKLKSATMPEFFGKRFNSDALKIVSSIIIFIFLIPYTASLYNGLSRLFEVGFGVSNDLFFPICIIIMAAITCIYVIIGGFMATAINDFIQGIIMLVGIAAVIICVLNMNGGLVGSMQALATSANGGWEYASLFGKDPMNLLFIVVFTSLGTWGLPQMVQKFYAIKNEAQIKKGTIISTLFAIVVAGGCYFLGGFGRIFATSSLNGAPVGGYDNVIPTMVEKLPAVLISIVIVLVLAASMSTLSSLVLSSSSTITIDLIKHIKKDLTEKKQMLVLRIFVVVFVIVSAVIAIVQSTSNVTFIAQLMGISWGALAGAFLAPFLYSLYWKRTTKAAVWASFGFGVGLMVINVTCSLLTSAKVFDVNPLSKLVMFKTVSMASSITCGVICMLGGLIIVPLVSLFTKAPEALIVDDAFSCYDREVIK